MIKYHKKPDFKASVLLAGWPGMGAVATQSVDYIRRHLNFEVFAEIEIDDLTLINSVVVLNGVASFTKLPRIFFFSSKDYDFIICEAEDQFSGQAALKVMEDLFLLTDILGINTIYTGAAFVRHMHYREESQIYLVANRASVRDRLVEKDMKILSQGQISGLNGSILGFASLKDIDAVCFLATIPVYSINFPNPKASMAITRIWQKLLSFPLDFTEYDFSVKKSEETFALVEEHLKKMASVSDIQEDDLPDHMSENVIPGSVIRGIEELFEKAKSDRTFVHKLKEELDRWNLFKEYEGPFLDLFRDSH